MVIGFFYLRAQSDSAAEQRTRVRQSAILSIRAGDDLPGDENDWKIIYPLPIIEWLADTVQVLGLKPSILEILETEEQYPDLMSDISIVLWQRRLIQSQMGENK